MNSMFNYLQSNVTWIFSGIGIKLITIIVLVFNFQKEKQEIYDYDFNKHKIFKINKSNEILSIVGVIILIVSFFVFYSNALINFKAISVLMMIFLTLLSIINMVFSYIRDKKLDEILTKKKFPHNMKSIRLGLRKYTMIFMIMMSILIGIIVGGSFKLSYEALKDFQVIREIEQEIPINISKSDLLNKKEIEKKVLRINDLSNSLMRKIIKPEKNRELKLGDNEWESDSINSLVEVIFYMVCMIVISSFVVIFLLISELLKIGNLMIDFSRLFYYKEYIINLKNGNKYEEKVCYILKKYDNQILVKDKNNNLLVIYEKFIRKIKFEIIELNNTNKFSPCKLIKKYFFSSLNDTPLYSFFKNDVVF